MTVTDSHVAVHRLERAVQTHRQGRILLGLTAAAAVVGALAAGAALTHGDTGPPDRQPSNTPRHCRRQATASSSPQRTTRSSSCPTAGAPRSQLSTGASHASHPTGPGWSSPTRTASRQSPRRSGGPVAGPAVGRPTPPHRLRAGGTGRSPDGTRVRLRRDARQRLPRRRRPVHRRCGHQNGRPDPPLRPGPTSARWNGAPNGSTLLMGFDRSGEGGRMVVDELGLATGSLSPLLRAGARLWGSGTPRTAPRSPTTATRRQVHLRRRPRWVRRQSDPRVLGAEPDSARLAWSPDGTKIVWSERFGGRISLLDVTSGRSRTLTDQGGRAPDVDWDRP